MPASLFDTSVWIAAVFPVHPFHAAARAALGRATPAEPAVFCRATQQTFLRLLSTPAVVGPYSTLRLTNRDALTALDVLSAHPYIAEWEERPGTADLWRRLAARDTPSPKVWMDAYLAAFALAGGLRLVSLDREFRNFQPEGLDLELLLP